MTDSFLFFFFKRMFHHLRVLTKLSKKLLPWKKLTKSCRLFFFFSELCWNAQNEPVVLLPFDFFFFFVSITNEKCKFGFWKLACDLFGPFVAD